MRVLGNLLVGFMRSITHLLSPNRVAKFITTMSYTRAEVVKPYAPKLLSPLQGALDDKSTSVRKSFANALANVAKLAAPKNLKVSY